MAAERLIEGAVEDEKARRFEIARSLVMRLSQKQAEALYRPLLSSSSIRRILDTRLPTATCVGANIKARLVTLTSASDWAFYQRISQTIEQNPHDAETLGRMVGTYSVFRFNASRRYVHTTTRIVAEDSGAFRFDQWENDDAAGRPLNSGMAFLASRWLFMVGFRVGSMRLMIARVPDHSGDSMHGIVLSQPPTVANPFSSRALIVPVHNTAEVDRFRPGGGTEGHSANAGERAFLKLFSDRSPMSFALDD